MQWKEAANRHNILTQHLLLAYNFVALVATTFYEMALVKQRGILALLPACC